MAWRPSTADGSTKGISAIRRGMECLWQEWMCSPPVKASTCSQTIPMRTGCRIVFCTSRETRFPSAHRMMRPFPQTHGMPAAYRFQLRPSRQRYRSSLWQKAAVLANSKGISVCGYGKLSSWDRIAERADATLIAASGSHVRASDGSVRIDDKHSRRLPVGDAHHSIDLDRRP